MVGTNLDLIPLGWEQPGEGNPVVDYDLLAALAQLSPGEDHELQASTSVTPSIVVQALSLS